MRNNQPIHNLSIHSRPTRRHRPPEQLLTSDIYPAESARTYTRRAHHSTDQRSSLLSNKRLGIALGLTLGLAGTFLIHGAVNGRTLGSAHASVSDTSPVSNTSLMAQPATSDPTASESMTTHDSGTAELIARNAKYQATNHRSQPMPVLALCNNNWMAMCRRISLRQNQVTP